ncbi:MAG TPA: hypothetical protein V6C88_17370 [Chroococcidiopsis sp.]
MTQITITTSPIQLSIGAACGNASTPGGEQERALLAIATNGQTVFTLPTTPALPSLTQLYLNGVKAVYGTGYVIDGSILNWLGVTLSTTDELELLY